MSVASERQITRLVVGLGNPGAEYEATRHNVGFQVVQALAASCGVSKGVRRFGGLWGEGELMGQAVGLLRPQTYMNRSGGAVAEAVKALGLSPESLLVAHDEIDLPLGRVKVAFESGSAGHKGVESIVETLGTNRFYRLRLGIGRPASKDEVERYVLSPFGADEEAAVTGMVEKGVGEIREWIGGAES